MQDQHQLTRAPILRQILLGAWETSWSAAWLEALAVLLAARLHTLCGMACSAEMCQERSCHTLSSFGMPQARLDRLAITSDSWTFCATAEADGLFVLVFRSCCDMIITKCEFCYWN